MLYSVKLNRIGFLLKLCYHKKMSLKRVSTLDLNINLLNLELSKYDNLPLHLAMLYLSLNDGNHIFFAGTKIISQKLNDNSKGLNFKVKIINLNNNNTVLDNNPIVDPYGLQELHTLIFDTTYRHTQSYYKKLREEKVLHSLSINTKMGLDIREHTKHNYVYARNKLLGNYLREITLYYERNLGGIPKLLLLPFLFFHKNSELHHLLTSEYSHFYRFGYCPGEKTLKFGTKDCKRTRIVHAVDLLALYNGPCTYHKHGMWIHEEFKNQDLLSYNIQLSSKDLDN